MLPHHTIIERVLTTVTTAYELSSWKVMFPEEGHAPDRVIEARNLCFFVLCNLMQKHVVGEHFNLHMSNLHRKYTGGLKNYLANSSHHVIANSILEDLRVMIKLHSLKQLA